MKDIVKIAGIQIDPEIMNIKKNLEKIVDQSRIAADAKTDLIVFPESALSGYVYASREEALPYMVTVPGPETDKLVDCAKELGVHMVVGAAGQMDPSRLERPYVPVQHPLQRHDISATGPESAHAGMGGTGRAARGVAIGEG